MGTRNDPSRYDCYAKAEPDEPVFVLLGRDPSAAGLVRDWARQREAMVRAGHKPAEDLPMVREARACADAMAAFRSARERCSGEALPPRAEDAGGGDGAWTCDGRLVLTPAYYEQPERVLDALLLTGDADATAEEVAAWTPEQRKRAAEWALSLHTAASDNDDVLVPPRPDFIRRQDWSSRNPIAGAAL